jgi:tight adherence protein B
MSAPITFLAVALAIVGCAAACFPPAVTARCPTPSPPLVRGRSAAPAWVAHALHHSGFGVDPARAWQTTRAAAGAAVAVTFVVASPLLAVVVAAAALAAPAVLRPVVERRWWDRRDAQLPAALERLAADLRAGSAMGPAFSELARTTPLPLRTELARASSEMRHGAGLGAALDRWARQPRASAEVRLAATALSLGAEAGGEVARSVDRVAATLRERRELRAEVHALATQARASAGVLVLAPFAFTTLASSIEPATLQFLTRSPLGVACLVGGLGLEAAGAAWMARILRRAAS